MSLGLGNQTKAAAPSDEATEFERGEAQKMALLIADALKDVLFNGLIQDVAKHIRKDLLVELQQTPLAPTDSLPPSDTPDIFGQILTDTLVDLEPTHRDVSATVESLPSLASHKTELFETDPLQPGVTNFRELESHVASRLLANESIGAELCPRGARTAPAVQAQIYGCVPNRCSSKHSGSTQGSCTSNRRLDTVRANRMKQLTQRLSDIQESDARSYVLRTSLYPVLRILGILPWDLGELEMVCFRPSLWYQWTFILLSLGAVVTCVARTVQACRDSDSDGAPLQAYSRAVHPESALLSDVILAVASFVGLLQLKTWGGSKELCNCNVAVLAYMFREGFLQEWKRRQRAETAITFALWFCAVLFRVRSHLATGAGNDTFGLLYLAMTLISTTMLGGLAYCSLYFCNALTGLIDLFGVSAVSNPIDVSAAHEWNVLLAVIRTASSSIEWCVFTLQTAALLATLLAIVDFAQVGTDPLVVAPVSFFVLNAVRVLFRAASVTDKCVRLPSLINALTCTLQVDANRQYVIDFIKNSAAGFYVFECRLTTAVALKSIYVCVAVVFASATRIL